ncbi:GNAT family N-acetyltransferase [Salininema proteolyticum]|uniref:GNAT family N-acetyltransferase n=1 Tax=Salininema proteolyticum TaxID=1607685 RepID=A0ABV8U5C5_9ACTN
MDTDTAHDIPNLVMEWGRGWSRSRRTERPTPVEGGFRIHVGDRGHRDRHIFHTYTLDSLRSWAERLDGPGQWIKVAGSQEEVREALPDHWRIDADGHYMTTRLVKSGHSLSPEYRMEVEESDHRLVAKVYDSADEEAASANLGLTGESAIFDRVSTSPAHRRRGLGTAVMAELADRALALGVSRGILGATNDGRALYERLGWVAVAELSGAFVPEGD